MDYLRDPDAIYERSFAAIRAEADLSRLPKAMHPVALRLIHASGMPDILDDLAFDPAVPAAVQAALEAGAPVLADCEAATAAIIRRLLPDGVEIVCALNDTRVPALAIEQKTTRSAAQVALWRDRLDGAVVVIGNAPTALFALLEALDAGAPKPAAILAFPVGFVGAAESKAELHRDPRGVPYVTLLGRRGGSAMAAAALNAIAAEGGPQETPAPAIPPKSGGAEGPRDHGPGTGPPATERSWLTIIGVGEDGVDGLGPAARGRLEAAEIVVGPPRALNAAKLPGAELHPWSSPLSAMIERILAWRGRRVVILATGDPMHYGIGATMARHLPVAEMAVVPAPSAFSLAAARLGWALQDVDTASLHGRPLALIEPLFQPSARILALTSGAETVRAVAGRLIARGYGKSRIVVLEHMGGTAERMVETSADQTGEQDFAQFNTLAIECLAEPGVPLLPRAPGLPDDVFRHDGQLTKREVRAVTLAALAPAPGALLWDVGAGCGSVAIEWMRAVHGGRAIAFERDAARLALIAGNAEVLGTPDLEIVAGDVPATLPATLEGAPAPAAVFLGGAVADPAVFETCWQALAPGGRMVANAVTLEGEAALASRHAEYGGELVRLDVAHATKVGTRRGFRPRMAVTQWRAVKP